MGWSRDIEAIILLSWGGTDWPDYMERPSELTFELRLHVLS